MLILLLSTNNRSSAQTPYFEHAILGIKEIDFGNAAITVDSFDSTDPTASVDGQYSNSNRRSNAAVALGSRYPFGSGLYIGNAKIAGYVAYASAEDSVVYMGPYGAVGDLEFLEQGGLGIQEGHRLTTSPVYVPEVEVPFANGLSPLSNVSILQSIVSSNVSTVTLTVYNPPENTDSVTTNLTEMTTIGYPLEGSYVGSVFTNWTSVMTETPPVEPYRNLEIRTLERTSTVYPDEGTYIGEVVTTTYKGIVRYTYNEITAYYYETIGSYRWNYISGYSFHTINYSTNVVVEIFDYVFDDGNYAVSSLSGKSLIRGDAVVYVAGDISISGQGRIEVEEGGSLKIFCAGDANFGGSGIVNKTGRALNFMFFGLPSNSEVSTYRNLIGCLYAPQAHVEFGGGGSVPLEVVGAVVGRSFKVNGLLQFHYDEALQTDGPAWEAPLVITEQPISRLVAPNQINFLSCGFRGSGPVVLRWWKDGAPLVERVSIRGTDSYSLVLDSAYPDIAGDYFLVLSNSLGSITSAVATVAFGELPMIESLSSSQLLSVGDGLQLQVVASGNAPFSYQWYNSGYSLEQETNASFVVAEATLADAGDYQVVVANAFGSVTSSVVNVVVGEPPSISSLTGDQKRIVGEAFRLDVTVSGTAPFSYQWLQMGGALAQETNTSLSISEASLADSGEYQVVVANAFGAITSAVVNVNVGEHPFITEMSGNQLLLLGQSFQLQVSVGGSGPFALQWYRGGTAIEQQTNAAVIFPEASLLDAGNYQVLVENTFGAITSTVVSVVVVGQPTPESAEKLAGEEIAFSASVMGEQDLAFQWQHNSVALPGATTSTITLQNLQPANSGSYSVQVSNLVGSVFSAPATLTVDGTPRILSQPAEKIVNYGDTAEFSVIAAGGGQLHYQWKRNNQNLADATNASFQLESVTWADAAAYSVVVSNDFGIVSSEPAVLSVLLDPPQITVQPVDQNVAIGSNVVFTTSGNSPAPVTYQWQYNGSDIPGKTDASLQLNDVQFLQQGSYRCFLMNEAGTNVTQTATLTVELPAMPFFAVAGVYNGLFAEPGKLAHDTAGFFTLKVRTNGRYSGKFLLDGDALTKSGTLNSNGQAVATIIRTKWGKGSVTVQLQLNFADGVVGVINGSNWQSDLLGFAAIISTNPVPGIDGRYSYLFPTVEEVADAPKGTGYSLLNVKRGKIASSGFLPDGSPLKQSVHYSTNGHWPFYSRHYRATNFVTNSFGTVKIIKGFRGSTIGWLTLSNQTPSGTLHCQMPTGANPYYLAGLTNSAEIIGSSYVRPVSGRILNLTNGVASLSGGLLVEDFTNSFFLKTNNLIQMTSTNKPMKLAFSPATGAFSGNFIDDTNRVVFRGAMLQNRSFGAGFFSPTNGSGSVTIEPAD